MAEEQLLTARTKQPNASEQTTPGPALLGTAAPDCGLLALRDGQTQRLCWHLSASTNNHQDQTTNKLSLIGLNSTG